jgi:hypothetical protein
VDGARHEAALARDSYAPSPEVFIAVGRFLATAFLLLVSSALPAQPSAIHPRPGRDWRSAALARTTVAAADHLIVGDAELETYRSIGGNTLVLFDTNGVNETGVTWNFKPPAQIEAETSFARRNGMKIILGMAFEDFPVASPSNAATGLLHSQTIFLHMPSRERAQSTAVATIPAADDALMRQRLALWDRYGADLVIGAFPWDDDVFWKKINVARQRHVYGLMKDAVPDWHVLGIIGEAAFKASPAEVAALYDPGAFDDLLVLMYPLNVGYELTDFPLDNIASPDPDGDIVRYVDHYLAGLADRFFQPLKPGQLILLVGQAFAYPDDAAGHIPRRDDVYLMMTHGIETIRAMRGQAANRFVGYFYWGADGALLTGLWQRPDWIDAARSVHAHVYE